jgi:hypothetical protein
MSNEEAQANQLAVDVAAISRAEEKHRLAIEQTRVTLKENARLRAAMYEAIMWIAVTEPARARALLVQTLNG